MKKFTGLLLVLVLVFGVTETAQAQWKLGVQGGVAFSSVGGDDATTAALGFDPQGVTGFVGTVYLNYAFTPIVSFQPGVSFVQKGLEGTEGGTTLAIDVDYFEIPLLLRFDVPTAGSVGVHFLGGTIISFEAGCDISFGTASATCEDDGTEISSTDFGLAAGAGLTFGIGRAALVIDGMYNLGLSSIDDSTDDFSVKNRAFTITAGFEIPLGR